MRIGELAARAGVEASTIRYYESIGLLPAPARTPSGYRDYGEADVDRVAFVRRARALGLSLEAIGDVLGVRERGEAPCAHVEALIAREREAIGRRIAELEAIRAELDRLLELAATLPPMDPGQSCVCHIIDATTVARRR